MEEVVAVREGYRVRIKGKYYLIKHEHLQNRSTFAAAMGGAVMLQLAQQTKSRKAVLYHNAEEAGIWAEIKTNGGR